MKKAIIICSVLAAIAITIGIILIIIGGTVGSVRYEDNTFISQERVEKLKVSVAAGEANVEFYDGDKVEIAYQTHSKYGFSVSESGGTIELNQNHIKWFNWIGFGIARKAPSATVKIPYGLTVDLEVRIGAGSVSIKDGSFGAVKCEVSAGRLTFGNTVCTSLVTDVSAGSLSVGGVTCGSIDCNISAGSAHFNKVVCDKMDIDVSAGSAHFSVIGDKADYYISVDKSAGSCNVTNQSGRDANKKIDIDVSAGSVSVNFN